MKMNKRGSLYLFLLLFILMIIFLTHLENLTLLNKKNPAFLYQLTDTSFYHDNQSNILFQENKIQFFNLDKEEQDISLSVQSRFHIYTKEDNPTVPLNIQGNWNFYSIYPESMVFKENEQAFLLFPHSKGIMNFFIHYKIKPKPYHPWIRGLVKKKVTFKNDTFMVINSISPPFGTRTWLMSKDTPYDKIDTLIMSITVPNPYKAISNGILVAREAKGDSTTFVYQTTYPTASYLIGLNIGPYTKYSFNYFSREEGISYPIELYFLKTPDNNFKDLMKQRITNILRFFETNLGPYPFHKENLKIVETVFSGGMENQTVIGVENISPENEYLIAHEIAHQWFGDYCTPDFHHVWLSEGFATFLSTLYLKQNEGEARFLDNMMKKRDLEPHPIVVKNITFPDSVYNFRVTYNKAAWILFTVYQMLGEKNFYSLLQKWIHLYHAKIVVTEDFIQLLQKEMNYNWKAWFQYFVKNGNIPSITIKISGNDKNGFYGNLSLQENIDFAIPFFIQTNKKSIMYLRSGNHYRIGPFQNIENLIQSVQENFADLHIIYP